MFKLLSPLAIAGALLSLLCLGAAPAQALSKVTFVSGKGTDTGTCADPANPCRHFQFAIDQTIAFGEVKALDPAHYGGVIINKSTSITGVEGAGIDRVAGDAITINAGPNDKINLSHLTIDGLKTGNAGISLNSGRSLTITHCTVRNFRGSGIVLVPTGTTDFLIGDTLVSDNVEDGILIFPIGGAAIGTLDHVLANKNGTGISVGSNGKAEVMAVDSIATNNAAVGFGSSIGGVLRLARSVATGNGTGLFIADRNVYSFGDNYIRGNGININGTLAVVPTD
ncbi:MAG: right-handed parallel beta-helix repeat-containing protein [Methylocella sp.]